MQCEGLFLATKPKKMTAVQIHDLFRPSYSSEGSNAREKELEVAYYWMNFLEECEGKYGSACYSCTATKKLNNALQNVFFLFFKGGLLTVTLEDVMVFATGCNEIPLLGFERQPRLQFGRNDMLPTAATCGPLLSLPLKVCSYEEFSKNMTFAITCSFGFGQV